MVSHQMCWSASTVAVRKQVEIFLWGLDKAFLQIGGYSKPEKIRNTKIIGKFELL